MVIRIYWICIIWKVICEVPMKTAAKPRLDYRPSHGDNFWSTGYKGKQQANTFQTPDTCAEFEEANADIDTAALYPTLNFLLNEVEHVGPDKKYWLYKSSGGFWDQTHEDRYEKIRETNGPELKVIVVPFSHNEPFWKLTFQSYFTKKTQNIINNVIQKLEQYPQMTFIWTDISYLSSWWEKASPEKQEILLELIRKGRVEITTGAWVMADEACTHIYGLLDQFIEGHLWLKDNLNITPKTGWSIDSFGHGPTVPYILDRSGSFVGTVIQRIHYAWKNHLANHQTEDFYWLPGWSNTKRKPSLIVHNQPLDHYSIDRSCGPYPSVCAKFDFKRLSDETVEDMIQVSDKDVDKKAKALIEQYRRLGSLTTHNVVLVPLGDDFRYDDVDEFDSQYMNYMKLFLYINNHKLQFNAQVHFGTPLDYFNAVKKRSKSVPTLTGDFFPYSESFVKGKPAYWTGFYTTRPYFKILVREFEHQLRTTEILFTMVYNYMKETKTQMIVERFLTSYQNLINARRILGLVQNHNGITGTSHERIMTTYGNNMLISMKHCIKLQELALSAMMFSNKIFVTKNVVHNKVEWKEYGKSGKIIQISNTGKSAVIAFNPLMEARTEVISVSTSNTNIKVFDTFRKKYCPHQITPMITLRSDGVHKISETVFDLFFVVTLPPLTAVTYKIETIENNTDDESYYSLIFCDKCIRSENENFKFSIHKLLPGHIRMKNNAISLLIDRNTGFLKEVHRRDIDEINDIEVSFGVYRSAKGDSGAYIFKPDYSSTHREVISGYTQDHATVKISGPVFSEVTTLVALEKFPYFIHKIRIYHVDDYLLSNSGLYIENLVNFEDPEYNTDTELFMQIKTHIKNGETPTFFTDQNGFQYQRRVTTHNLGIEGNYYPITTMVWLQDRYTRMTLLTNHAQGVAAFKAGHLEIMLDRRTEYDDLRGLGQGVTDSKRTLLQNWLTLESFTDHSFRGKNKYELPSAMVEHLSRRFNYPVNVYVVDTYNMGNGYTKMKSAQPFTEDFPSGLHLVTLRTLSDDIVGGLPSSLCLMVLQLPGRSCTAGTKIKRPVTFSEKSRFVGLRIKKLTAMSLTGLKSYKSLTTLEDIEIQPMEIKTYRIHFGTYEYKSEVNKTVALNTI